MSLSSYSSLSSSSFSSTPDHDSSLSSSAWTGTYSSSSSSSSEESSTAYAGSLTSSTSKRRFPAAPSTTTTAAAAVPSQRHHHHHHHRTSKSFAKLRAQLETCKRQYGPHHAQTGIAYSHLGNWFYRHGDWDRAGRAYHLSAYRCQVGAHTADALANVGAVYWTTGEWKAAQIALQQALKAYERWCPPTVETKLLQANVYHQLGLVHTLQQEALTTATDGSSSTEQTSSSLSSSSSSSSLSSAAVRRSVSSSPPQSPPTNITQHHPTTNDHHLTQALSAFYEALCLREQYGTVELVAKTMNAMGQVCCLAREFDSAVRWYQHSLQRSWQMDTLQRLAAVYAHALGEVEEAITVYRDLLHEQRKEYIKAAGGQDDRRQQQQQPPYHDTDPSSSAPVSLDPFRSPNRKRRRALAVSLARTLQALVTLTQEDPQYDAGAAATRDHQQQYEPAFSKSTINSCVGADGSSYQEELIQLMQQEAIAPAELELLPPGGNNNDNNDRSRTGQAADVNHDDFSCNEEDTTTTSVSLP